MNRRGIAVASVAIVGLLVLAMIIATRPPGGPATAPSPSPTVAASSTPSPTAPTTASPSPTVAVSPTPSATVRPTPPLFVGRSVNAAIGYSIELTPPWRRSDCFSYSSTREGTTYVSDTFMAVPAYDEEAGDVGGIFHGHVSVSAQSNPQGLTPRQWIEAGRSHNEGVEPVDDTFAGKPALRISAGEILRYLIPHDRWMLSVDGAPGFRGDTTREQRAALIATIRFLDPQELAAARAAATPSPAARTPQQVAAALERGFAQKDVAALRAVIDPGCISQGAYQAGVGVMNTERFLDQLEDRFARGLTVEVKAGTLTSESQLGDRFMVVGSVWREPGQPDTRLDLMIQPEPYESEHWLWTGTLANAPERSGQEQIEVMFHGGRRPSGPELRTFSDKYVLSFVESEDRGGAEVYTFAVPGRRAADVVRDLVRDYRVRTATVVSVASSAP